MLYEYMFLLTYPDGYKEFIVSTGENRWTQENQLWVKYPYCIIRYLDTFHEPEHIVIQHH